MTYRDQIDNIMDNFEFGRVAAMMEATDWGWGMPPEVPDEHELRVAARARLREAAERGFSASGGFTARDDGGVLRLYWGLSANIIQGAVGPDSEQETSMGADTEQGDWHEINCVGIER